MALKITSQIDFFKGKGDNTASNITKTSIVVFHKASQY